MSYRVEVQERKGGEWTGNAVYFASTEEAELAMVDLMGRWLAPYDFRVAPIDKEPNYRWVGGAQRIDAIFDTIPGATL